MVGDDFGYCRGNHCQGIYHSVATTFNLLHHELKENSCESVIYIKLGRGQGNGDYGAGFILAVYARCVVYSPICCLRSDIIYIVLSNRMHELSGEKIKTRRGMIIFMTRPCVYFYEYST